MKKIASTALVLMLGLVLTGCSLFSAGKESVVDGSSAGSVAAVTGDIAITDSYTHTDPEGLEYAARYALTTGKDDPFLVESFKSEYGADFVEQLAIIYASDDDKVVGEYDYYVFADEKSAELFGKAFDVEARGGSIDGCIVSEFMDEEMVNMIIDIDVQYGSMDDNSATSYVVFMKDVNVMMEVR